MSTALRFNKSNPSIAGYLGTCLRRDPNEGIVRRVQNQSGHGDLFDNARRRGTVIVILRSRKAAIVGSHLVVELPQTPKATATSHIEVFREQSRFIAQAAPKLPQKVNFVQPIGGRMQRVSGGSQVDCRTDAHYTTQFPGR